MISLRDAATLMILVGIILLLVFIFFPFMEGALLGAAIIFIGYGILQFTKPTKPYDERRMY